MKHYVKIIRYRVVTEPLRGIALADGEAPEQQPQIIESLESEPIEKEEDAKEIFQALENTMWELGIDEQDIPF